MVDYMQFIKKIVDATNITKDKENLTAFVSALLSMQGPDYFENLDLESCAASIKNIWTCFSKKIETPTFSVSQNPFHSNQIFFTVLSKDYAYILKTIQYTLKHAGIKTKDLMHPVLKTKRDKEGNLIHIVGVENTGYEDYEFESVVHCIILSPLTQAQIESLKSKITDCFKEIIVVNADYKKCIHKIDQITLDPSTEEAAFLEWLNRDYYSFYGYRYLEAGKSSNQLGLMTLSYIDEHPGLKPSAEPFKLRLVKAPIRSSINRCSRYDLIEIADSKGIHQFIGIFTSDFFATSAFHVPMVRLKVEDIFKTFGFNIEWYNGKLLKMVLDSIPLDLFFQLDTKILLGICQQVISNQKSTSLYINNQPTYNSIILFLSAEKYSFALKEKIKEYFENLFGAKILSEHVLLDEQPFARLFYIQDTSHKTAYDLEKIQLDLNAFNETWEEKLARITDFQTVEGITSAFPKNYQIAVEPKMAIADYQNYCTMVQNDGVVFNIHQNNEHLELHMFNPHEASILSDILPILEKFGLEVLSEATYSLKDKAILQIFTIRSTNVSLEMFKNRFLSVLHSVWVKESESDYLNQLILSTSCTQRHLEILRAFIKFSRQTGLKYSYSTIVNALTRHAQFAQMLIQYFENRFDPKRALKSVQENLDLLNTLEAYCSDLKKIEDDRMLRHLLSVLKASIRTNYYQNKKCISIKFQSKEILNLPKPHPLYEIFVYSPKVEGVHLRGGKVARGGIRFSDREDDFRSEVLGLMKAQMLKNSVIVPVGSKGGFIVKGYEEAKLKNPQNLKNMLIEAYQIFISGLLDITDNIIQNKLVKPEHCICYDNDDPYLVVAADKGTASFSDIANALSLSYNFWLGDAFASGGSKGYDHKKMGITAKGAWVSVQRHFKELGVDVQNQPFSVCGVGDMAGDVFGNGMLRSEHIRLVAAFNHEHIFLDPNPDLKASYIERKRLFENPSLKWADYNPALISAGGGIYERQSKIIQISPEMKSILNVEAATLTPEELIQAILKAPVDLLYFGGIGTFIKASTESHMDVQDKANDAFRINARDVRAKVVAEGANLGTTQLARIEYALRGGHINTDAIDNSAGVDCSDHEVNIKILLNQLVSDKTITETKRDAILVEMTDEVASLVLSDNAQQTFLLSVLERNASSEIMGYQALMDSMTKNLELPLNKKVEFLPDAEELSMRQINGLSFTRPELATLTAYAKIHLYQNLLKTLDITSGEYTSYYKDYFPKTLQEQFDLEKHPLKREILCTVLANYLINRCGPKFIHSITTIIGEDESKAVIAFFKIIEWTGLDTLWDEVFYSTELSVTEQYEAWEKMSHIVRKMIFSYLRHLKSFDKATRFKANLDTIIGSFMSECEITGCTTKRKLELLMYYPIAFEVCAHYLKSDRIELSSFADSYKNVSAVMGFDFLLEMQNHHQFSSQWEMGTKFILDDDLLKSIVGCVLNLMKNGSLQEWKENRKISFNLYESNMNTIKILYPQNKNNIALMVFATKQLELFNKEPH